MSTEQTPNKAPLFPEDEERAAVRKRLSPFSIESSTGRQCLTDAMINLLTEGHSIGLVSQVLHELFPDAVQHRQEMTATAFGEAADRRASPPV